MDPIKGREWKERGNVSFRKGDLYSALSEYVTALKYSPNDPDIHSNRALVYLKLGFFERAMEDCQVVLDKNPKHVKAINRLASAHIGMNNYTAAVDALSTAIQGWSLPDGPNLESLSAKLKEAKELAEGTADSNSGDHAEPGAEIGGMKNNFVPCPVPATVNNSYTYNFTSPCFCCKVSKDFEATEVDKYAEFVNEQTKGHEVTGEMKAMVKDSLDTAGRLLRGGPCGPQGCGNDGCLPLSTYIKAYSCFTEAIGIDRCQSEEPLLKKGQVSLSLRDYWGAIGEAKIVLVKNPSSLEAVKLLTDALFGLKEYKKGLDTLVDHIPKMVKATVPQNVVLKNLVTDFELYVTQSETGTGYSGFYAGDAARCAEFTKRVEVAHIPEKGRGLVATENMQPGDAVLVTKAFTSVKWNYMDTNNHETRFNILVSQMADLLSWAPRKYLWDSVLNLWAGRDLQYVDWPNPQHQHNALDLLRVSEICKHNYFHAVSSCRNNCEYLDYETDNAIMSRFGLWHLPSYINHSCWDGNVFWRVYGDVMFIRAIKPIRAGEEITMNYNTYMSSLEPYATRLKTIFDPHGFTCSCSLCKLDRSEPKSVVERRAQLLLKVSRVVDTDPKSLLSLKELLAIYKEMDGMRKDEPRLNLPLIHVLRLLVGAMNRNKKDPDRRLYHSLMRRGFDLTFKTQYTHAATFFIMNAHDFCDDVDAFDSLYDDCPKKVEESLKIAYDFDCLLHSKTPTGIIVPKKSYFEYQASS